MEFDNDIQRRNFKKRQGSYLPHWSVNNGSYAVTFRLFDSLPQNILREIEFDRENIVRTAKQLRRELSQVEKDQLQKLHSEKIEGYLNTGYGSCWMKDEEVAKIVANALLHFDKRRYDLVRWCVMPNHVHVIFDPKESFDLESILHSWKSFTAHEANRVLHRKGTFWHPEYYDHIIRDEEDLKNQIQYVVDNPAKAGLKDWKWVG